MLYRPTPSSGKRRATGGIPSGSRGQATLPEEDGQRYGIGYLVFVAFVTALSRITRWALVRTAEPRRRRAPRHASGDPVADTASR